MYRAIFTIFFILYFVRLTVQTAELENTPDSQVPSLLNEKSPEHFLVEQWDQGITPMAPQKYDGKQGIPQKPFSPEKNKRYRPLIWKQEKEPMTKKEFKGN